MDSIIASTIFIVLGVLFLCLGIPMRRGKLSHAGRWGNPMTPNGTLRYNPEKHQRSAGVLLEIYSGTLLLTAAATIFTKLQPVLPEFVLTLALYLHGAVLILALVGRMVYMDTCAQIAPETEENFEGDTAQSGCVEISEK